MKKKLLVVLVIFAVLGAVGFGVYKYMGQRRVSTSLLATPFASAPADVKALIDQAAAGIKSADYLGSVKALKAVADKGGLSKEQKAAIDRTLNDISGMKLGAQADAVTEVILEIQTKLAE
jgi:hypothetical protein